MNSCRERQLFGSHYGILSSKVPGGGRLGSSVWDSTCSRNTLKADAVRGARLTPGPEMASGCCSSLGGILLAGQRPGLAPSPQSLYLPGNCMHRNDCSSSGCGNLELSVFSFARVPGLWPLYIPGHPGRSWFLLWFRPHHGPSFLSS